MNYTKILLENLDNLEIVKVAIENGADVTAKFDQATRWASFNGDSELVKELIKAGADVTAWDNQAIKWANYHGHLEVVKVLEEAGGRL